MAKNESFPKDAKQTEAFALNLVKIIHEDEEIKKILQESMGGPAPASTVIGAIAGQILTLLFTKLKEQTKGAQVNTKFVIEMIRVAVKELTAIYENMGTEVSVEEEAEAAKVAGDSLDGAMNGEGAPQEAPQQGVMQEGAPQQAPPVQGPPQAPQGVMQGGM